MAYLYDVDPATMAQMRQNINNMMANRGPSPMYTPGGGSTSPRPYQWNSLIQNPNPPQQNAILPTQPDGSGGAASDRPGSVPPDVNYDDPSGRSLLGGFGDFMNKLKKAGPIGVWKGNSGAWVGGQGGGGSGGKPSSAMLDIAKQFIGTQTFGSSKSNTPAPNPPSESTTRSFSEIINSLLGGS